MKTSMPASAPNPADNIFAGALSRPAEERETYVVAACGQDESLLAEVNALLSAHDAIPTGFLSEPAGENMAQAEPTLQTGDPPPATDPPPIQIYPASGERRGDVIGRYKLLQEIGSVCSAIHTVPKPPSPISCSSL